MQLSEKFLKGRTLHTMVENQTTYSLEKAEMHVFETHQMADQVLLKFRQPVLASMIEGKKVMHLSNKTAFDFLPGESIILPPDELMCIDFPEAQMENPTRCLAMTIMEDKIHDTIGFLNETRPRSENFWIYNKENFHFTNDIAIQHLIQRLLFVFTEDHPSKDVFADFMIRELIIRILQTENRKTYSESARTLSSSHRLAFIIDYIRKHLHEDLNVKTLSNKAYMSESNFHRVFKNELGVSPTEFINNERIKLAKSLLKDPRIKIKEIYLRCGFNSLSYFIRVFKKKCSYSPKAYQEKIKSNIRTHQVSR